MTTAIAVQGLVKTFGSDPALDGLDLEVETGEVHGFLGPNGSGKSTTIRCCSGCCGRRRPGCQLLGGDPWRDAATCTNAWRTCPGT